MTLQKVTDVIVELGNFCFLQKSLISNMGMMFLIDILRKLKILQQYQKLKIMHCSYSGNRSSSFA